MVLPMECPHDRVVRLVVAGVDHWICNLCNASFVLSSRVDWKVEHLAGELTRLIGIDAIASSLFDELIGLVAICPGYPETAYAVIDLYRTLRSSSEQAARVWREEGI